uniref:Uncharacterized protein n=1 Tax=Glossina morsitans morsitans TaxID=37546 RepID=A0A1B0FFT9_GLOMM
MCDAAMGGGVLNLVGSHVIDLVSFLLKQQVVAVLIYEYFHHRSFPGVVGLLNALVRDTTEIDRSFTTVRLL